MRGFRGEGNSARRNTEPENTMKRITHAPAKSFRIQARIGKSRHVVSFYDGEQTHPDGSPFFAIRIFGRRKDRDAFTRQLRSDGYTEH